MPIIKSAIKKVRKDKKRTKKNSAYVVAVKNAIKKLKQGEGDIQKLKSQVYSQIDKAVKHGVIHKNKGNRLKSRISKLVKVVRTKAAK